MTAAISPHSELHQFVKLGGRSLYVAVHVPDTQRPVAVVFCLPIHEEQKSAYRPCVDAARAAAERGLLCARFHYAGTGDSDGDPLELTLESMVADAVEIAAHIRSDHGANGIILVGIRLGAAVALRAAEALEQVGGVMLIEPVQKGRTYVSRTLTRKRIRKMVTEAEGGAAQGPSDPADQEPEVIDFDGHPISPAQRESIEALELASDSAPLTTPVLILEIAGRERTSKAAEELAASLCARGATVATRTLVSEPFWNSLGVVSLPDLTAAIADFACDPEGQVAELRAAEAGGDA